MAVSAPGDRASRTLARLRDQLRQKSREVELLHAITQTISSTLDLDRVLKEIIERVIEISRGDSCLVYLLDRSRRELVLRASKNPHPRIVGQIALKVGEGITGWVARERQPVVIARRASEDPRFKVFHNLPEDRYEAFLSLPIIAKSEVVGVVNVQHKRPHRYPSGILALLTTMAHQVGGAIENARLYEEARRQGEEIQTLSQALEDRKVVERAKGVLMKRHAWSEEEAYKFIHRRSMDLRRPMRAIAEALLLAEHMGGNHHAV